MATIRSARKLSKKQIQLIANGDLRLSANQVCWPAQKAMEDQLAAAVEAAGYQLVRAHHYKEDQKHGFIQSQKEGMEVFRNGVDPKSPLIVAEAVWQYSHHILHGLIAHDGPICTVANWSGQWPGLVGMLNLNGSLTKAGVKYSTLWSADFTDDFFLRGLRQWLSGRPLTHDASHVHPLANFTLPSRAEKIGQVLAADLRRNKAIMGIFDEGCMGMYNAIIPDELLHRTGVFKERLSQSALYAAMRDVSAAEAGEIRRWLDERNVQFRTGPDPETDLTDGQIQEQCKMY